MMLFTLLVTLSFTQSAQLAAVGRVAGRVVVEGSNTPVSDARVTLMPTGSRSGPFGPPPQTVTDRDGRFTFEGLVPGMYRIDVQKTGFAPLDDSSRGRTLQIAAGQSLDAIELRLQRGGAIAGRVLDAGGEPLPDAHVMALRRAPSPPGAPPRLMPAPGQSQQTNDLGEFRVSGLPAGEYYVAAMPRPGGLFGAAGTEPSATGTAIASTYYPGTVDPAAALPIAVVAGDTVNNITFTMQSAPAFRVSGIVVDENGGAVSGTMVTLMGDPRSGAFMGPSGGARTQDDGRFTINGVPSGSYRLMASVPVNIRSWGSGASSGSSAAGGGAVSVIGSGGGGFVSFSGGAIGTTDRPTEIIVADADVGGVRIVIKKQ